MNAHEATALIAFGNAPQAQIGVEKLRRFIADGGDVNTLLDDMTALGILMAAPKVGRSQSDSSRSLTACVNEALDLLIEVGADPWAGTPNAWNTEDLWNPMQLLEARRKTSSIIRGANGENDLHALLRRDDHILGDIFHEALDDYIDPAWLNAVDNEGRTPLHVLWSRELTHREDESDRLDITKNLMWCGARLDIPSPDGVCVAHLIMDNLKLKAEIEGDDEADYTWDAIQAIAQSITLQQTSTEKITVKKMSRL